MEPLAWVADGSRPGGASSAHRVMAQLCCCSPSSCACSSHCSPALAPQVKGAPGSLCLGQVPALGLPCTFPQPWELLPSCSPGPWTLPSSQPPTALGLWMDHLTTTCASGCQGMSQTCTPSAPGHGGTGAVRPLSLQPVQCPGYPSHRTSGGSGHFTAPGNVKLGMV